jgi:ABC-type Mn2+/Zn2+ transport system ATPase subunit
MAKDSVVLRFEKVTFEYQHKKPLLEEVSFAIRGGAKLTLMGQNGAGKSSLFKLIMGELKPQSGRVSLEILVVFLICSTARSSPCSGWCALA